MGEMVDVQAAHDAVAWWEALETGTDAARRMDLSRSTLSCILARAGLRGKHSMRKPAQWWNDVVAMHGSGKRFPNRAPPMRASDERKAVAA